IKRITEPTASPRDSKKPSTPIVLVPLDSALIAAARQCASHLAEWQRSCPIVSTAPRYKEWIRA
ncbi:MAG: hypothetical protein KKC81_10300, partial [Gammaproteobacteria bacterium]|nr:hypothetical protein [Gammaproteobacteria bacterium]